MIHDYGRSTRTTPDDSEQVRMECSCGKKSRWYDTNPPVFRAIDRHADIVARYNFKYGVK